MRITPSIFVVAVLCACGGDDPTKITNTKTNTVTNTQTNTVTVPVTITENADCDQSVSPPVCVLSGTITDDITLTNDINWILRGGVFIGDDTSETVLTLSLIHI